MSSRTSTSEENKSAKTIQKSIIERCPTESLYQVYVNPFVPKKDIHYAQSVGGTKL